MAAAVEAVLALDPGPRAVLVSGDVADDGDAGAYELALELLRPLGVPVFLLPGNHDDRATMREVCGLPGSGAEPIRYSSAVGELRLIVCDTLVPGSDAGRFDPEQREWLAAELAAEADWPTIVALHHPPIVIGLDALDRIGLPDEDRSGVAELLAANRQVRRVIAGHVHRGAFDVLGGCGVFTCPATHLQAPLEVGMPELGPLVAEPPAFALHVALGSGAMASHVQPIA